MERTRRIRNLRIAVSAVCGILCGLLITLWVPSYYSGFWTRISRLDAIIVSRQGTLEVNPIPVGINSAQQRATAATIPYSLILLLFLTLAGLPWVQWSRRYNIRNLLIVTALFAFLLALIAAAIR